MTQGDLEAAPHIRPRLVIVGHRWAGLACLALLPLMSALGAFEARSTATLASSAAQARFDVPTRLLAYETEKIEIEVRALQDCDPLRVLISPSLLSAMEELQLTPAPVSGHVFERALRRDEVLRTRVEFQMTSPGRMTGDVRLECGQREVGRLPLSLFVFP